MESCEPPAALNTLLWPVVAPKNRVGGSAAFSFVFAFQYIGETLDTPAENGGCGYDFASGVHKYLYAADDPVDNVDPSGNDYGLSINVSLIYTMAAFAVTGIPLQWIPPGAGSNLLPPQPSQGQINWGPPGKALPGSPTFTAPGGESFLAPPGTSYGTIYSAGQAIDGYAFLSAIPRAAIYHSEIKKHVGIWGIYDFQRNLGHGLVPNNGPNTFYKDYRNAGNFGVGVYMNGAGFSRSDTTNVAVWYKVDVEHTKPPDQNTLDWELLGWDAAQKYKGGTYPTQ